MFNTPILFLIFNRPDVTERVFAEIRKQKPKYLYIAADGARANKEGEAEKCEQTRKLVLDSIDWDCEVKTLFRDRNLGCGLAVSGAISWFFENVEQGIILEDDCLPNESFFGFCEEMLDRYKDNEKVMHIGCNNLLQSLEIGKTDYYFSNHIYIWGWATWRRAWQKYDIEMRGFDKFIFLKKLKKISNNVSFWSYWLDNFKKCYDKKIDTWDYQWTYAIWQHNAVSVLPKVNLVSNIGFREDATHTISDSWLANMPTKNLLLKKFPNSLKVDKKVDNYIAEKTLGIKQKAGILKKIKQKLRIRTRIKFWLSKLITEFITQECIDYTFIEQKIREMKINSCTNAVTMGKNSKFYEQAQVQNSQGDITKINIGVNTHILGELLIFKNDGKIKIGDNCYISKNTIIWSASSIKIGNDVLISHNCNIVDTNAHEIDYLERAETYKYIILNGLPDKEYNVLTDPIIIEDNVWINFNVIILKGVTIGKGAIVAAGSVVTKDVAPFTMVAGNPAKFIKYINT